MTLFFPDLNVWLALSDTGHTHSAGAWKWMKMLPDDAQLIFSRYTQVGFLRLLTNISIMGDQTMTLRKAWAVYDRWLEDPRVEFYPEPRNLDAAFREITQPFAAQRHRRLLGIASCWPTQGSFKLHWSLSTVPCMATLASMVTPPSFPPDNSSEPFPEISGQGDGGGVWTPGLAPRDSGGLRF